MKMTNKDIYYAILVLGASSIITGLIMVILGETGLVIGLGATKLVIAIPVLAYTIKHKVGQRTMYQRYPSASESGYRDSGSYRYPGDGGPYKY